MHKITLVAALVACGLSGCVSYTSAPTDLARDTAQWLQVSSQLCPANRHLNRADMLRIGLMLNTELNKARLNYAKSTSVAEFAGLWDDPSLSVEVERVFKANLTNKAISPGLTLPVTGLPALAKKIAEHYKEADYWDMRDKERKYMAELECLRHRIMVTHEKLAITSKRLRVMEEEQQKISRLHELGEVDFGAFQVATQRLNDTRKEQMELEALHLEQRQELVAMLGLHPALGNIELAGSLPGGVPAAVGVPGANALLASPSVKSLQAAYGASETELRAEIRKQYPELGISPLYGSEEGNSKVSVGVEFSLPLWNRNREAIATAGGNRALKQAELIAEWRKLLQQAGALGAQQTLLRKHCATEHSRLGTMEAAAAQQEKLFGLGETSILEVAESRHVAYERRLAYLDCLGKLLEAQCKLQYLNPAYQQK